MVKLSSAMPGRGLNNEARAKSICGVYADDLVQPRWKGRFFLQRPVVGCCGEHDDASIIRQPDCVHDALVPVLETKGHGDNIDFSTQ